MNSFIPEDFKEPVVANYMKFGDGENSFRILSPSMITGFVTWETVKGDDGSETRRPKRTPSSKPFVLTEIEDPEDVKVFWAFVVWNYNDEKVQILEITQKTLRKGLKGLVDNKKWGDVHDYDITVIKVGQKKETRYDIMPNPKEPLDKKIIDLYNSMNIDLNKLFTNEDPFGQRKETVVTANDGEVDMAEVDKMFGKKE